MAGPATPPTPSPPGTNPLVDMFAPPAQKTVVTTTTTTTITTRPSSSGSTESVLKTASGRKSIRARSSTRTLTKREGISISMQNVEGLQNIGEALEEETLNLLDLINEQVVNPGSSVLLINQSINKIYEHLQILFILTAESAASHHGSKLIGVATERIQRGAPSSAELAALTGSNWYNLDEVNGAVAGFNNLICVKKNLVPTIAYLSTSVRVLGLQASLEAEWMSRNRAVDPEMVVVQLACLSRELLSAMARLLSATQAFCSVCTSITANNDPSNQSASNRGRSPSTADLINIWDELKLLKEVPQLPPGNTPLRATLNQLVLILTSESNYDSKFLKTFITTYQSFAPPRLLFTKLLERYTVPEWYTTNKPKISTIQQRVIVILKYWIVNQSSDFDQDLVDQIYYFIDNTLQSDGYSELSKVLRDILNKMVEEREVKLELLFQMPPRIQFKEDSVLSPIELFNEWSPLAIAQQLSLIDFSIFKEIEARELLNQNFNKPKMKYRAPNIMRMINRFNQFSFWVAMLILLEGKKDKRLKVFEKLLEIAKHLLKLNNFNTLMSLVAGLNMSPIHRLKKTKKKLSSSALATFTECERVFSSKKSFKNYRDLISVTNAPCIPYLGINLTDLTFIEDGNPDYLESTGSATNNPTGSPLINFKKRELFYTAWSDIARFQESPYQFAQEEPLNTFLLHFPQLEEKDLYELSIALEPRDDWTLPAGVTPVVNSGFFSENRDASKNVNTHAFDVSWRQVNPSQGVYATNIAGQVKDIVTGTFAAQNATTNPFWFRLWTSGDLWAPSWIKSYCNVSVIGKDYDNEQHLPIWNPCVWSEILKTYRYIFVTKNMRADPRLKMVYVPGAFNWCEFDFDVIGNFSSTTGYPYATFNTWFQQAMQDLVNIFNGENNDPSDDYAYKLVYTGEDYPFDVDFWPEARNFLAKDAVLKGMGIRTGITELSNFHLSHIPAYGVAIDANGYMVLNKSWILQANPNRIIATENECYKACGFSVSNANLFYAIKMSNYKAIQMGVNWLYVQVADSYMAANAAHWNWVRMSLGRTAATAIDAWAALRNAEDTFWKDNDSITWKGHPYVKNYERFLLQRDVKPGAVTKNGTTKMNKVLAPENGIAWEGRSTNIANGNNTIAFYLDDEFILGNSTSIQIKVTYLDKVASSFVLHYNTHANVEIDSDPVTVGTSALFKTATFTIDNGRFVNSIAPCSCDFTIRATGTADIEILFVRVVKL
eukprot:gene17183-20472_t